MPSGLCKQTTAEPGHLIVGGHFTRTCRGTQMDARTEKQKPGDKNTCLMNVAIL